MRNAAIGSVEGDLRTAGDFWMEPVCSSLAGACFPLVLIFRAANMPNTRDQRSYNAEHDPAASTQHGTAMRFRIGTALGPREVAFSQEALREWELFTMLPLINC
jgi:hypothetical protein